jgi:hypothetical protein
MTGETMDVTLTDRDAKARARTPLWREYAVEWRNRVAILAAAWQRTLRAEGSQREALLAWVQRVSLAARGACSERETKNVLTEAAVGMRLK